MVCDESGIIVSISALSVNEGVGRRLSRWRTEIVLPLSLIALGGLSRNVPARLTGWAVGQAEVIGALIAALYKTLTGRAHPLHGGVE